MGLSPSVRTGGGRKPVPFLLSEADFAALYAAFAFAWRWGLWMDTSITITWRLLGSSFEADVQGGLTKFLKCLRDWLSRRSLPVVYAYVHEAGRVVGTHTHIAILLPLHPPEQAEFRRWARDWAAREAGHAVPRALKVQMRRKPQVWLHWLNFHYMMKGYDQGATIVGGSGRLDQTDRHLGELLAFAWKNPGAPAVRQRFGVSDSIGPGQRALGVPGIDTLSACARSLRDNPYVDPFRPDPRQHHPALRNWRPGPFRSAYENGSRDVRELYPPEFVAQVDRGWARPPLYVEAGSVEAELKAAIAKIWQLEEELWIERIDL